MTIEISDEDVIKSLAAYRRSESWSPHWVSCVGMRAALESFVARHPELAPKRAMHEPVTEEEVRELFALYEKHSGGLRVAAFAVPMMRALDDVLGRRAEPPIEPVVVTEEMAEECAKAFGWTGGVMGDFTRRAALHAMNWLADRIAGEQEKPVDPRVEIVGEWLAGGFSTGEGTEADIRDLLAKLDEVKA